MSVAPVMECTETPGHHSAYHLCFQSNHGSTLSATTTDLFFLFTWCICCICLSFIV